MEKVKIKMRDVKAGMVIKMKSDFDLVVSIDFNKNEIQLYDISLIYLGTVYTTFKITDKAELASHSEAVAYLDRLLMSIRKERSKFDKDLTLVKLTKSLYNRWWDE